MFIGILSSHPIPIYPVFRIEVSIVMIEKMIVQIQRTTLFLFFLLSTSCASYERFRQVTEEFEFPSRLYEATYDEVWQATLFVVKKFDLANWDQTKGSIKTRWMDNTKSYNFSNVFGFKRHARSAQFQLRVNISKGFRNGREVATVSLYKRQLVEQDALQGTKEVPSDGIEEKTILYRIGRKLKIEKFLNDLEKKREQEQVENFGS
ncbi:MAG: hypothetical protein OXB88_07290 [Bacteriovoracales bacterium]|nr:hypothetical protein [Bacteriovoracales bacterium]